MNTIRNLYKEFNVADLPQSVQFLLAIPAIFGIMGQAVFGTETQTGGGIVLGLTLGTGWMCMKAVFFIFAHAAAVSAV